MPHMDLPNRDIFMLNRLADPCEYNPDEKRAAFTSEKGHADAEVMVGANGQWRLCNRCAELPEFKKYRVRKDIEWE